MDTALLYSLVSALDSPEETERHKAVLGLEYSDRRVTSHLIRVLRDEKESGMIRGDAAECLSLSRRRRAIKPLVECSTDASSEVRFWCVFGLGQFVKRRKTPMVVVRALERRLEDNECPDNRGNWWPIRLEALAMLRGCTQSRLPIEQVFKETIFGVLRDPLRHRDLWRWADCYYDVRGPDGGERRSLYESALQEIREAGFEPARFGQEPHA